MVELQKKAAGPRPQYFDDPAVEKLMSITMALAGEVAVLHDRLDTHERLAAAGVTPTPEAIDEYVPDDEVRQARDDWRETFLDVVLRVVHQEREALEREAAQGSYDDAVNTVETD